MRKYSVFGLYVITINGQKFICESIIYKKKYREVLTGRKIDLKVEYKVERLSNYYPLLERMNYTTREPLILTKEDILDKYIDINTQKIDNPSCQEKTKTMQMKSNSQSQ